MSLHKTEAIILKNSRSGESSLLVGCFLRDGGRRNLLAKGARNPKSALVGKLEPFSVAEVLYYQSSEEKLGVVSQVDIVRSNTEISEDIRRLGYASAVVEILEALATQPETSEEIYDMMQKTLYQINYCHGSKLEFFLSAFLLKLLSLSGFHPEFNRCVRTGADLTEEEEVLFSAEAGGVVARDSAEVNGRFYKLNLGTRKVLNVILDSDIDALNNVNFSNEQKKKVRALLLKFLAVHADRVPTLSSLDFLERIRPEV